MTRTVLVPVLLLVATNARADRAATNSAATEATASAAQSRRGWLPMTMLALGGAAVVGGTVALVFDQDAIVNTAMGPTLQPSYREMAVPGAIAIAAGAVFAGAGGYLYWKLGHVRTNPTGSATTDRVMVGIASSF